VSTQSIWLLAAAVSILPGTSLAAQPQILARVGEVDITADQLSSAVASSPFANGFPTLEPGEQARIRGNMLVRLVDAEVLRQEAKAIGLDNSPAFRREVDGFRSGALYQQYVQSIRAGIELPADLDATYKRRYRGNPDALAAARSAYLAKRFREQKAQRFRDLAKRYSLKTWPSRLSGHRGDTLLAEADGFAVHLRDLRAPDSEPNAKEDTPEMRQKRLDELLEIRLAGRAARDAGIDVTQEVADYVHALLPRMLLENNERKWIDDPSVLRDYFQRHPEIGRLSGFRNIGQIVLSTQPEAEKVRERILAGESLFELASELSIDPYGRARAGDMGWQREGNAHPAIEKALEQLDDNELSPVIETPAGYHLVMILARKPGWQRTLPQVEDRVRQAIMQEHLDAYLQELRQKHRVTWLLPEQPPRAPDDGGKSM
jgi:peptidyl-prolyl cis-trans isomerase C